MCGGWCKNYSLFICNKQKGYTMDIKSDIEKVRSLVKTLQNWDSIVKEKQLDAIWGHSSGFDSTKVQTYRIIDRMESAIIEMQEYEERREAIIERYWNERNALMQIIEKYAGVEDMTILHRYVIGCELSEIPLKGKQNNPKNVVNGAIKRLQKKIEFEEEIERQPETVQKLIRGEKKKCKYCETGFIKYKKEEADRFIFVCDGCGKRLKVDKIGTQENRYKKNNRSEECI